MMLLLLLLLGVSHAQLDAECEIDDFAVDGYQTGQNIDLDLDGTHINRQNPDGNGDVTYLTLTFLVPQRYVVQAHESSFAITFNRETTLTHYNTGTTDVDDTSMHIKETGTGSDDACFTNRYHVDGVQANNRTQSTCEHGLNEDIWSNQGKKEGSCLVQMEANVKWADVMTNNHFGNKQIKDDGTFTQIFLLATVETWTRFTQTTTADYKGQMTGREHYSETGGIDTRKGSYFGDGGDMHRHFDPLHMDDERYTLYQIPFILRFPKTVIVETSFTMGTKATTLIGLVRQDQIRVNFNPRELTGDMEDDFAAMDVVVQTKIQYPYGIRDPEDPTSRMTVRPGPLRDLTEGADPDSFVEKPAQKIYFLRWDEADVCRSTRDGDQCTQEFAMRILPRTDRPCSVEGSYTMEFWATCIGGVDTDDSAGPDQCSLDVLNDNEELSIRRDRNGYFQHTFEVEHTNYCPEVMDTVYVRATMIAYHSEGFGEASIVTDTDVYTNDIMYYQVTYRTATTKNTEFDDEFVNNDPSPKPNETPNFIDYVRAVKIYVDVTIGKDMNDARDAPLANWVTDNWKENVSWTLGGTRMANDEFDDDPSITLVSTPDHATNPDDKIQYRILLCEVEEVEAKTIQTQKEKARDCFDEDYEANTVFDDKNPASMDPALHTADSRGRIAVTYFDFNKVNIGDALEAPVLGDSKEDDIKENEIGFKMRLDERIIPVGPETDDSHIRVTVESEVYYTGNRHPTRRRLQQIADNGVLSKQMSIQSHSTGIRYRMPELHKCDLDEHRNTAVIELKLKYPNKEEMPKTITSSEWASTFAMQMNTQFQAGRSINILDVHNEKGPIYTNNGLRRVELNDDEILVRMSIKSNKVNSAGVIANTVQDAISNGLVPGVKALRVARVVGMEVPHCDKETVLNNKVSSTKLTSSATVASTLFAFVAVLISLL